MSHCGDEIILNRDTQFCDPVAVSSVPSNQKPNVPGPFQIQCDFLGMKSVVVYLKTTD